MKKFLSLALVAVMLVATISIAVSAEMPKAEDFTANNGFYLFEGKANKTEVKDPATIADTATGVQVKHGGYYQAGDNCGGVYSTEKYDLNGFEATVYFEQVPAVVPDADCWVAIDFLRAPGAFFTNNFDVENGGNQGIMHLIRYQSANLQVFEGVEKFAAVWQSSGAIDATQSAMFDITSGTKLTVKLARNEKGNYILTFARDGFEDLEIPYEYPMRDVFTDGKAHFAVIASNEYAGDDAWVYYITDVKNGVEMTEEDAANIAAVKHAEEVAVLVEEATKETNLAKEKVDEMLAEAQEANNQDAIDKLDEAYEAIDASFAAIEAEEFDEARVQSDLARDIVKEAKDIIRDAEKAAENGETKADDKAEQGDAAVENQKDGAFPVVPVVIAVVVVLLIVVVVVLVSKKKKN